MKKIFYNSWIANHLLFKGYSTITLTAFVCTKLKEEEMPQSIKNHECVHAKQWVEMFVIGWLAVFVLQVLFNASEWLYLLPFLAFYLWYGLEYLIKSIILRKNAYSEISFEKEARLAESDNNYLENCDYFEWFKLLV